VGVGVAANVSRNRMDGYVPMMTSPPRILALVVAGLLAACRGAAPAATPAPAAREGAFAFVLRIGADNVGGVLRVTPALMEVDLLDGVCTRLAEPPRSDRLARFTCSAKAAAEDLTLTFDRTNLERGNWSAVIPNRAGERQCIEYAINNMGNRVCSLYGSDPAATKSAATGEIRLRAVTAVP